MKNIFPTLLSLLLVGSSLLMSCSKQKDDAPKGEGLWMCESVTIEAPMPENQKKALEDYVYAWGEYKMHQAMNAGEREPFDMAKIREKYQMPKRMTDAKAIEHNQKLFDKVEQMAEQMHPIYVMPYVYATRNSENDIWTPNWSIVLIGDNDEVLVIVDYLP